MLKKHLKLLSLNLIAILFTTLTLVDISSKTSPNINLPLFEIMMIFYFAIYRKNIFGMSFIFFIGFLSDALNGLPLGMTSLIYICVVKIFIVILQKHSDRKDFLAILREFIIFIAVILSLKWLFLSIYYQKLLSISPFLIQIIITSALYILMHRFFELLNEKLVTKEIDRK